MKKAYILYCRPYKSEDDEPPISEVWFEGDKPKKKLYNEELLFIYDVEGNHFINQRPWDGNE